MININFSINDKPFNLSKDEFQFVVGEVPVTDKKTGAVKWTANHYFRTLAGVSKYLVDRGLTTLEAISLEALEDAIMKMELTFEFVLKEKLK